jgi:hypothetical protein
MDQPVQRRVEYYVGPGGTDVQYFINNKRAGEFPVPPHARKREDHDEHGNESFIYEWED